MNKKSLIFLIFLLICGLRIETKAQFNTITDQRGTLFERINTSVLKGKEIVIEQDTIVNMAQPTIENTPTATPVPSPINSEMCIVRKKHLDYSKHYGAFPDLTLGNLLLEIRRNGIQYENVVLAQAILETGWFTSSVCRNKKNLFGLTNPRTGDYYEFDRWQDSVKAYYTKVQYKYKGGNYLLWLDRLPYAEANTYIASLIGLLKQYFI